MKRIAIIGGGISGLAAAYEIEVKQAAGLPVEYVLYESSSRLGGVMVTDHIDDCLVEAGPDSFLTEKPWASDLCRKVGLGDQLIGSNDPQRKTYILVNGRLVVMPDGLMFMVPTKILPTVLSPLFSVRTKLRMAGEWFHPPHQAQGDETVASMVERHYGAEMVERLADPLLSGVYGGEADQLSARAVLARFADMEARHGSLGRAMLASRRKMAKLRRGPAPPLFTSLENGMQQMVDAVMAKLNPASVRTGTSVEAVLREKEGWRVVADSGSELFDSVIVATPAQSAANLVSGASNDLAALLRTIRYSSSVTVTLGYDKAVRDSLPPGFGFLIPRSEGKRMLAATFVHNKFPHRAPEDRALIRCFLGGARDEQILDLEEDQILQIVRSELRQIIGLTAEPRFARVYKWRAAMAQYSVGHLERLDQIERLRQKMPGLAFAGNGFRGIGVPDCVKSGRDAVENQLRALGLMKNEPIPALAPHR